LLQAQNAAGATVDSAGLTAMIVAAPRSLNLQVNESNPIFRAAQASIEFRAALGAETGRCVAARVTQTELAVM
jgi:hypothetical protein